MTPTPGLALLATAGTPAHLGLAVLGGGGSAAFSSCPARVALVLIALGPAGAALFSGGNLSPGEREDRGNRAAWETPEALGRLLTLLPYGRIGRPEDVARAAAGLAPDLSDRVAGTALFVGGGTALHPWARGNG